MSYQIKFVCLELKDDIVEKFIKNMESLITDINQSLLILTEAFNSFLFIISKVKSEEMRNTVSDSLCEVLDGFVLSSINNNNLKIYLRFLKEMLSTTMKEGFPIKIIVPCLKIFVRKILSMNPFNLNNNKNEKENMVLTQILCFLFEYSHNICKCLLSCSENQMIKDLMQYIEKIYEFYKIDKIDDENLKNNNIEMIKEALFKNLSILAEYLPMDAQVKKILPKYFEVITLLATKKLNLTPFNIVIRDIIVGDLINLVQMQDQIENSDYFILFFIKLNKLKEVVKPLNWRNREKFLNSILKINLNSPWVKEEHCISIKELCYEFIEKDTLKIQRLALKLLTRTLRYVSNYYQRQGIINHMNSNILKSNNFYTRKLYIYYFDEVLEIFSLSYLKENYFLENILILLDDPCIINRILLIRTLKQFFLLIDDENIKKNILGKIDENRNSKDYELKETIKAFDNWLRKTNDISEQKMINGFKYGEEIQINQRISSKDLERGNTSKNLNDRIMPKTTRTRLNALSKETKAVNKLKNKESKNSFNLGQNNKANAKLKPIEMIIHDNNTFSPEISRNLVKQTISPIKAKERHNSMLSRDFLNDMKEDKDSNRDSNNSNRDSVKEGNNTKESFKDYISTGSNSNISYIKKLKSTPSTNSSINSNLIHAKKESESKVFPLINSPLSKVNKYNASISNIQLVPTTQQRSDKYMENLLKKVNQKK